jgi:hypothetical protein
MKILFIILGIVGVIVILGLAYIGFTFLKTFKDGLWK